MTPARSKVCALALDSLYFVMNNLTTIGTGDVHAVGQVARVLVLIQMVFNVVFVATTATFLTTRIRAVVQARVAERRTQDTAPGVNRWRSCSRFPG